MKITIMLCFLLMAGREMVRPSWATDFGPITISNQDDLDAIAAARQKAQTMDGSAKGIDTDEAFIQLHLRQIIAGWREEKAIADVQAAIAAAKVGDRSLADKLLDKVAPRK